VGRNFNYKAWPLLLIEEEPSGPQGVAIVTWIASRIKMEHPKHDISVFNSTMAN
jgi:hypothetical protein